MGQDSDIEETNSGVKKKGKWKDVTKFAEDVEEAMEESGMDEEALKEYNKWRPRLEEAEQEVKKKTVDEAALKESKIEEKSKGPGKDLEEAAQNIGKAGEKIKHKEIPDHEIVGAADASVRPFASTLLKLARWFEKTIYSKLILRSDIFYFDTEKFSANMKPKKDGKYEMEVNIPEKKARDDVRKKLSEQHD